MSASPHLIG